MPTKLIQAYRNGSYGPPLVTQKYAPLEDISFSEADKDFCDALLTRRWSVVNSLGLLPEQLRLTLSDWPAAIASEKDKKSPLVVISSNRSKWIRKGIEAGTVQLSKLKIAQFDNASDLRALTALSKQKTSPPIYSPARIGEAAGRRNVYIVVYASEYDVYRTNLAGFAGITVVGWQFRSPRRGAVPLCGFGASRFAAIEFCKELRTAAEEPWDYAWLFDDNVVALAPFAGYDKVEAAMAEGETARACAGFHGGTSTIPASKNSVWAAKELKAGRGKQTAKLPASKTPGLVQQASLWNIAYLTEKKLNFGPIFVASGEDVSIGNYLDVKEIPYLYYESTKIFKEDTENDGGPGAEATQRGREQLTELMAESEWIEVHSPLGPPPPIMFKALKKKGDKVPHDAGEQTLGRFIVTTVLPHASLDIKLKARDPKTKNTAMCQATEQSICKAIKLGQVRDPALDKTFKINGEGTQDVERVTR